MSSVAVVTGAANGLGRCFAEACARRGYNLILADLDESALTLVGDELAFEREIRVQTVAGDLTDQEVRNHLIDLAAAAEDSVGLWINNAGISGKGPAHMLEAGRVTAIAALNVSAFTDLAVRAIPLLLEHPGSRMINVSSLGAFCPIPYMAAYASSKSYILHFSIALNCELANTGVMVSALCPGGMRTNELTIRDLDGQGFFGRLTTHSPESIAELTLKEAEKGKAVIVPGRWNRFLRFLSTVVPKRVQAVYLERRWRRWRRSGEVK